MSENVSRRSFVKMAFLTATGAAAFAVAPGQIALAEEPQELTAADEDSLIIEDETGTFIITVEESGEVRTVTVTDAETGHSDQIIYDINQSTVYSTYTQETTALTGELALQDEKRVGGAARSRTAYSTRQISYAQIKSAAGTISSAATLAAAILAFVPGATMAASVSSLVSAVADAVNNVTSPSTSHGVKVRIATTKYYRRGNHIPYRTVKQVTGASLY